MSDSWITFFVWIGLFLLYFSVEFVISIFFTFKIKHVAESEYTKAAFTGSMSTFLFMFSTLLAAWMASTTFADDYFFNSVILMLFWTTLSLALGNFLATISIPKMQKIFNRNKKSKEK